MNVQLQRQYEMFVRARDFRSASRDAIGASPIAMRLFDDLDRVIARIEQRREEQVSGDGNLRKLTTAKRFAHAAVRKRWKVVVVTSRAMPDAAGSAWHRMPPRCSHTEFIAAAAALADGLERHADVYLERGMPDDFVARLRVDIKALDDVQARRVQQALEAAGTRVALASHIKRGFDIVRQLDGILLNLFADDDAALAAWKTARRVDWWQRARKKNTAMAR